MKYSFLKLPIREIYNDKENETILKKNMIVEQVAKEKGLKFLDINYIMMNLCEDRKTRYLHVDHVHFENRAKLYIARKYLDIINSGKID